MNWIFFQFELDFSAYWCNFGENQEQSLGHLLVLYWVASKRILVFAKECNQRVGFECRLGGFAKFSSEMHSSVKAGAQIWAEKAGSSSGSQAFQTQVHKCLL